MSTQIQITPKAGITVGSTAVTSGTVGRVFFQGTGNVVQQDAGFLFDATAKTLTNFGKGGFNSNTSFGVTAGQSNVSGIQNSFFGFETLTNNQTGSFNTAMGYTALRNTTGIGYNTAIGWGAGVGVSSGFGNTLLGYGAGSGITTGNSNTIIGVNIATLAAGTTNNVIISDGNGNIALRKDANHFVGVGYSATATLGARLDVRAQGALSTDIAFRVRNSADTQNSFQIDGTGQGRIKSTSFTPRFAVGYDWFGTDRDAFIFTQNVNNFRGQAWTFDAGYNGVFEGLQISNDLTGNDKGQFTIQLNNYCFGTSMLSFDTGTAERRVLRIANGVAPTTSKVDEFKFYSADIVAGNAAPHFRTENGSVIKLYKQDLPTNPTNAQIATFLSNLGLANLI